MTHILLVHGAWHGAWCWYRMIPALAAHGVTAHTLDLPGHGLRAHEPQTLAGYAEAVAEKLRALPEPAALLGHSMGGQVIAAAAELAPERITTLIHLCGFHPKDGESILEQAGGDDETELAAAMLPLEDGRFGVTDEALKPTFYADCRDEDIALARMLLVPQAGEPFQTAIRLSEKSAALPHAYILCAEDKALGPKKQQSWIDRSPGTKQVTLATSHSPFFSAPDMLAMAIRSVL